MGYGYYHNVEGRECGYLVEATCDHPGCDVPLDRSYDYLCGTTDRIHSTEAPGCGGYFCPSHRRGSFQTRNGVYFDLCEACRVDPVTLAYLKTGDED